MTEEKQNPEESSDKIRVCGANKAEGKKICCWLYRKDALKRIIIGLVGFALIVLIFGAGMFVGGMKAKFSYRWAENYHKNFAGPKGGFLGDWQKMPPMPGDFIEGHGVFGEIIEMNPPINSGQVSSTSSEQSSFVIKGRGDIEKVVIVAQNTVIKKGKETIKDGLKVGDTVVIIGSPNENGQIEAKLIRFLPSPPTGMPRESFPSSMRRR